MWKTLLEEGIPCAGGSDAPVELPTPLIGMHDAIFRRGVDADDSDAYKPEQCLTFAQALDLYTVGGAYACGDEDRVRHSSSVSIEKSAVYARKECGIYLFRLSSHLLLSLLKVRQECAIHPWLMRTFY